MKSARIVDSLFQFLPVAGAVTLSATPTVFAQVTCASGQVGDWFPASWITAAGAVGDGVAMSPNGETVAIAATRYPYQSLPVGKVWLVRGWGDTARVEAELVPSIFNECQGFGSSLAFSEVGDVLAVGAPSYCGWPTRVYVYEFDGVKWVETWSVSSAAQNMFGQSVSLDGAGDLLAVGAPLKQNGGFTERGAVFMYRRQSTGWLLESTITPAQLPMSMTIGLHVKLSRDGNVLAVSSASGLGSPVMNGAVYILERSGTAWVQVAHLQEPVAYSLGGFGTALSMDAEAKTLAVGNFQDSRITNGQGAVSIFRNGSSGWVFDTVLLPANPSIDAVFGRSVALNAAGDRLRVGAPGTKYGALSAGAVEELEFDGTVWQRSAVHFASTPEAGGIFGFYVVQGTATGDRWVASESQSDDNFPNAGQVHFFESRCLTPKVYCTAQTNSLGCAAHIASTGSPSMSSPTGFTISASNIRNQQNGMLIYGTSGRAATPWLSGTLCVQPPLRRTPLVNSQGSPGPANDCSGTLSRDFNAWIAASHDPALFLGQRVRAQYYSRDPGSPHNLNLSNAVEFYLEP